MPFQNEHAARQKDPDQFDNFRRKRLAEGVAAIFGIKGGKSEIQSIRFNKKKFTPSEAKKWLRDNNFSSARFESAVSKAEKKKKKKREHVYKGFVTGEPEGGVHVHTLQRGSESTMEDGSHMHLFVIPGGQVLVTQEDGEHRHILEGSDADSAREGDSAHMHRVFFDGEFLDTSEDGEHTHENMTETTAFDGLHKHKMTLPDGTVVESLSPGEFWSQFVGNDKAANQSAPPASEVTNAPNIIRHLHEEIEHLNRMLDAEGPSQSPDVAFVGAFPSSIDKARGKLFAGAAGDMLEQRYIRPLGIQKSDCYLTTVSGEYTSSDPDLNLWRVKLLKELEEVQPKVVVALGRIAKWALGDHADFFMPHPEAVIRHGDSGEVNRKVRAVRKALIHQAGIQVRITKSIDERQVVLGVVLEPETYDAHEDIVGLDEIEATAYDFMRKSRVIGRDHTKRAKAEVVESYLAPVDFDLDGELVKKGTWVVGIHVKDPELWQGIKKGDYTGLSMGGFATREPV